MGGAQSGPQCCKCTPEEKVKLLPNSDSNDNGTEEDFSTIASVVQFSSSTYYCCEDEGQMLVDIVRYGDASGPASCEYRTEDNSAKHGQRYIATSGEVQFGPHETIKTVGIPILSSHDWDACVEFRVIISRVRGAQMGKYLYSCRVKVIDTDIFPSNKHSQEIKEEKEDEIPGLSLMIEYIRYALQHDKVRIDTLKCLILDQAKGLYFFLTMYLQMYLVDVVLAPSEEDDGATEGEAEGRRLLLSGLRFAGEALGSAHAQLFGEDVDDRRLEEGEVDLMPHVMLIPHHRRETAMIIGIVYILPMILLHFIDQYKCYLCIPGEARKSLQANLLRKFVHYDESIRAKLQPSEIIMAMIRDVVEVVDKGYMKVLNMLCVTGKLMFALIFVLAENRSGTIPLIVYPVVLGAWLALREKKTIKVSEEKAEKQDDIVHTASDAISNFRLISGFNLRSTILDDFETKIDDYHDQESIMCSVVTNNTYMAPWLTTLLVGGYMICGAYTVTTVGGTVTLGAFLTTINVFKEVGEGIKEIYSECIEIQLSFGPLKKICYYMNLETDLIQRMALNRRRRKEGRQQRELMREETRKASRRSFASPSAADFAVDKVKIAFKDLSFSFNTRSHNSDRMESSLILSNVNVSWAQGKLYALVGPPRQGKGTVAKLLGNAIVPQEGQGDIFVPPHLRIAHVDTEATILHLGAFRNIVLEDNVKIVGGIDRVRRICRRVGLSSSIRDCIDAEWERINRQAQGLETETHKTDDWTRELCQTDHARINLARAFLYNPELLVLHKPLVDFNHNEQRDLALLLREHVEERGIELPEGKAFRRPRTVFFTATTSAGIDVCDEVYNVAGGAVNLIGKEQVRSHQLLSA